MGGNWRRRCLSRRWESQIDELKKNEKKVGLSPTNPPPTESLKIKETIADLDNPFSTSILYVCKNLVVHLLMLQMFWVYSLYTLVWTYLQYCIFANFNKWGNVFSLKTKLNFNDCWLLITQLKVPRGTRLKPKCPANAKVFLAQSGLLRISQNGRFGYSVRHQSCVAIVIILLCTVWYVPDKVCEDGRARSWEIVHPWIEHGSGNTIEGREVYLFIWYLIQ